MFFRWLLVLTALVFLSSYLGAQSLYVRDAHPNTTADAIVDNTDPEHPKRRFADFCSVEPAPL